MGEPAPPPPPELRKGRPSPMPNPSNSDLVGEARRLSVELRAATFPGDTKSHRARAAVMIERLAQQLEQAREQGQNLQDHIDAALHHFAEIDRQRLDAQPPPQAFWDRLRAVRAALTTPDSSTGQEEG